jgi:hypothetical protein
MSARKQQVAYAVLAAIAGFLVAAGWCLLMRYAG